MCSNEHEQTVNRDKTADVKMRSGFLAQRPRAFSAIFFFSSVVHMLIHGAIVTVEALGPAKTSEFGNLNTDQTWLRCNIPFYRAVVVADSHLLLSVAVAGLCAGLCLDFCHLLYSNNFRGFHCHTPHFPSSSYCLWW